MSFKDWLTGDKVTNTGIEYSPIYWITLSVVLLILILLIVFSALKKIPNKIKQNVLIGIAIFQLAFEVVWRIIFVVFKISFNGFIYSSLYFGQCIHAIWVVLLFR